MAAVKKVGLASDIIPSLEELHAIRNIKVATSRIIERRGWKAQAKRAKADRTDWDLIVEEWFKVEYYRRSKPRDLPLQYDLDRLSKQLDLSISSGVYCIEPLGYYVDKIYKEWGSQFDTPEPAIPAGKV